MIDNSCNKSSNQSSCNKTYKKPTNTQNISLTDAIDVCNDFINSIKGTLTNDDLIVLDMKPMYKPKSKIANFYEFKIGTENKPDNGYIIVSMTFDDYPIVEFSLVGDSIFNKLKEQAGTDNIKVLRFGDGYCSCEDINGKFLASVGDTPVNSNINTGIFGEKNSSGVSQSPNASKVIKSYECQKIACNQNGCTCLENKWYDKLKSSFVEYNKTKAEKAKILELWQYTLSNKTSENNSFQLFSALKDEKSSKQIVQNGTSPCDNITLDPIYYDRKWAIGCNNQTKYSQIPPNQLPNTTDAYSGCGPTAWMNLLGWHNLNFTPGLLKTTSKYNNSYINELTMGLNGYLNVWDVWFSDQGATWPWNISNGLSFVNEQLGYFPNGYSWRWRAGLSPLEWLGLAYDGYWIFERVQDYIENKRLPIIVGYFEDWHYVVAYETIKRDYWFGPMYFVHLNNDKWITPSSFFACVGVEEFSSLLSLRDVVMQPEFEADLSLSFNSQLEGELAPRRIKKNKMIVYNGIAILNSHGGYSDGRIYRTSISFLVSDREFTNDEYVDSNAIAGLNSLSCECTSFWPNLPYLMNGLYAVDSVRTYRDSLGRIGVTINIAIRDSKALLERISYRVIVYVKEI